MMLFDPPAADARRTQTELIGTVAVVRFFDPDTGAIIAKLRSGEDIKGEAMEGEVVPGARCRFLGRWENHYRWGWQFAFETVLQDAPHEREGIVRYLMANARGVGKATAEKLWDAYGTAAVEILRSDPASIADASIMSADAAESAATDLEALVGLERTKIDLFTIFSGRGFPRRTLTACIEEWGAKAPAKIRRDPFKLLLAGITGAGFKRCDKMYIEFGHPPGRMKRQVLAVWDYLRNDSSGHTWHQRGAVKRALWQAVGDLSNPEKAFEVGVRRGIIANTQDTLWIAERKKAHNETRLAHAIAFLQRWDHDDLKWPAAVNLADISEHQRDKIGDCLQSTVGILGGSPGTGKSFSAARIIKWIASRYSSDSVAVCAPTGKAAVRITEALAGYGCHIKATTIHKLLEIGRNGHDGRGWGFQRNRHNRLKQMFLFVDECSMIDTDLAADLFDACEIGTHVLLIGDPYQLPPVGHGAPLRDLIDSGKVPCGILSEIQRNAGAIVRACAAIKDGKPFETFPKFCPERGENLQIIEAETPNQQIDALRAILRGIKANGNHDPAWDCQVIVSVNEKSDIGRKQLNPLIQRILNPLPADASEADAAAKYRVGDKLICLRNALLGLLTPRKQFGNEECADKTPEASNGKPPAAGKLADWTDKRDDTDFVLTTYVANGEIGEVLVVDAKMMVARFEAPDRIVRVPVGKKAAKEEGVGNGGGGGETGGESGDFDLAYAITGHKSQGSEWPIIIAMIDDAAGMVAGREWVYTVISRAKLHCFLVGKRATLDKQCRRVQLAKRKTFLRERLQGLEI